MKKRTAAAFLLAAVMTMSVLPVSAEEDGAYVGNNINYKYEIDADGNVKLYDFLDGESFTGELVIPSEIEGHPVTYIGNGCFMSDMGITSVVIPKTVTDMGESVFFDCEQLDHFTVEDGNPFYTVNDGVLMADGGKLLVAYPAAKEGESYTVPDGVEEIGGGAFGFAQHLREVVIPDGVLYIDNWAFGHAKIEKADIAGSVIQIDTYAFAYCNELSTLTLGNGINNIQHAAFAYDEKLTQVTLPSTLVYVGQYAFCGTGLSCITIPNSIEDISYCAFGYDADLNAINDFTIYGEPNTMAQMYATAVDADNDYENHFNFIAVEDASIPYELGGGKLYVAPEDRTEEPAPVTETNAKGEVVIVETDAAGNPVRMEEKIGAGLFGNKRLQLFLAIGGGLAILLAAVLLISFLKKTKAKPDVENLDQEAEKEKAEEKSEDTAEDTPEEPSGEDTEAPEPSEDAAEDKDA